MRTNRTDFKGLLNLAIEKENAFKGTLQRFNPAKNSLEVIASKGFTEEFLWHFRMVRPFDSSCCGRAFGVGSTIVISDVESDEGFRPNLEIARSEGFKAVKSMPILTEAGNKIGVLSVHFAEPKFSWDFKKSEIILPVLATALQENS